MKEIILFGAGNKALWYTRILSTLSVKLLFLQIIIKQGGGSIIVIC